MKEVISVLPDADIAQLKETYEREGFLIVDFGFPVDLLDQASDLILNHKDWDAPTGYTKEKGVYHGARLLDAWKFNPAVKKIATFPTVLELLKQLYGKNPLPFQTLNFPIGTEQNVHSDLIHFDCWPNDGSVCGVWLALEDIDEINGPLVIYPRSHRLPELFYINFNISNGPYAYKEYEAKLGQLVKNLGLMPRKAILKKGQALLWAGNILHGGDAVRDKNRTRMNQATHYFFEGSEFYWTPLLSDLRRGKFFVRNPGFIPMNGNSGPTQKYSLKKQENSPQVILKEGLKKLLPPILFDVVYFLRRRSRGL